MWLQVIGSPTRLGIVAGWRGKTWDALLTPLGAFVSSMPYFWFGLIVVTAAVLCSKQHNCPRQ